MDNYKKINLASKLSLFIPVHNRHYYLERAAYYYKDFVKEYGLKVYIGDSSEKRWEGAERYPEYEYYYYSPTGNLKKLEEIIKNKIKTEYMILLGDDDFVIPSSIIECVSFLIENPGYSAAHGEFLKFNSITKELVNKSYSKIQYYNLLQSNYFSHRASERICHYFDVENFFMINHSVVKTKAMQNSIDIQLSNNNALFSYRFSDQQYAMAVLLEGNIKALPCLFALRDDDRMLNTKTVPRDWTPELTFEEFIPRFFKFGQIYIDILSEKDGISKEEAYFLFGRSIEKLITGRKYSKAIDHSTYKDFLFPSSVPENKKKIQEIFEVVFKFESLLPTNKKKLTGENKKEKKLEGRIISKLKKIRDNFI